MGKNDKILLGLSGGIDSEYSAKLLKEKGYSVEGMYINMLQKSAEKVRFVAESLGIPLHIREMNDAFLKCVISPFVKAYTLGKTPNPCVECNRFVKIQTLLEESEKLKIPYIATGHYANISMVGDRYAVSRARDTKKDQSYFLWKLTQSQLKRLVFPLGTIIKEDVLKEASKQYKESQDICFVEGDYRDFLRNMGVNFPTGKFVDTEGNVVGEHSGIHNYTRGQRKGLGVALGYPAFVTEIDPKNNTVVLGKRDDLKIHSFKIHNLNFVSVEPCEVAGEYSVKTRYRATPVPAFVKIEGKEAYVELAAGDDLVTPGQSAVFYNGDYVAFGGEILQEDMK